jgi:hypothetical protein
VKARALLRLVVQPRIVDVVDVRTRRRLIVLRRYLGDVMSRKSLQDI